MDKIITFITIETVVEQADVVSTLETKELTKSRRDGNSTRQVNFAIEKLYEGFIVKVQDHFLNGTSRIANQTLFNKILWRMELENGLKYLFDSNLIRVDKDKLTIELI